jgi:serine/threonine-protein kinase HipA
LVFNVLIGNRDNHLKNISFLADPAGINLAPAYDLLSTAVYGKAFANERAHWPRSTLPFTLGTAPTFADVKRKHLLAAAQALGLAPSTARRYAAAETRILDAIKHIVIDEMVRRLT